MNRTKIEWCDYTINPVKGLCPMACPYCYARAMYKRFKWDETIRMDCAAIDSIHSVKTPSRIFVGSTMELFGEWIPEEYYDYIWGMVRAKPQHTFIFLTKYSGGLAKFSPFPDNCWVGVSATDEGQFLVGWHRLKAIQAKVKFFSLEPLLKPILIGEETIKQAGINWLIIGQRTPINKTTTPKLEWVEDICHAATLAGIPAFLKGNLKPLYPDDDLRQEFPK
uniref:Radical SAM superfamily protein n=1 Tax=viral metagenome TaxID=1070528 RepID=A0A6M3JWQ9_9ZZZZ